MKRFHKKFFLLCLLFLLGCQKKPTISAAADNHFKHAKPPMGSLVGNEEFLKRKALVLQYLDNKVAEQEVVSLIPDAKNYLNVSVSAKENPALYKKKILASFYFYERRFIEAAFELSSILDEEPLYPETRSMLARCFYFLGNPNRALLELEFILTNQNNDLAEVLEALFYTGSIIVELKSPKPEKIKTGISAFEVYLKLAPTSPQKDLVLQHIKKLKAM